MTRSDSAGLGRVLYQHVDVVFADYPFEYPHVLGVADLDDEFSTPELKVSLEHVVAILRDPDQVRRQSRNCVAALSMLRHRAGTSSTAKSEWQLKSCTEGA